MDPQLVYRRLELPRKSGADIGYQFYRHFPALIDALDNRLRGLCPAGFSIQCGDLTEGIVQRHKGEAKAEHPHHYQYNRLISRRCPDILAPLIPCRHEVE